MGLDTHTKSTRGKRKPSHFWHGTQGRHYQADGTRVKSWWINRYQHAAKGAGRFFGPYCSVVAQKPMSGETRRPCGWDQSSEWERTEWWDLEEHKGGLLIRLRWAREDQGTDLYLDLFYTFLGENSVIKNFRDELTAPKYFGWSFCGLCVDWYFKSMALVRMYMVHLFLCDSTVRSVF